MKKIFILILIIALVPMGMLWAGGGQEEPAAAAAAAPMVDEGPEDWDAIYEAAKVEGKVVLYCLSSRVFDIVESFQAEYPGIEVEAYDIPGVEQVDKLTREQDAGLYNVDVLNLANGTTILREFLPQGVVTNYVPQTLLGGALSVDVIPENLREPILVGNIEAKVVFFNTEKYPTSPVDSLWDLTRPEWKGKVQMKDPMLTDENMNFLQMVVKNADKMAEAYKEEFGENITLSNGVENAGYEFIKRLANNGLVLTTSDGTAAKAAGAKGQSDPPITLTVASSKLRYNDTKDTALDIAWNMSPKMGISKANYIVMAKNSPHPNAAKLLIRWMLGDEMGGAGMTPFFVPGQWPSRSDVKPAIDISLGDLTKYTWFLDLDYIYDNGLPVRDFWLSM